MVIGHDLDRLAKIEGRRTPGSSRGLASHEYIPVVKILACGSGWDLDVIVIDRFTAA